MHIYNAYILYLSVDLVIFRATSPLPLFEHGRPVIPPVRARRLDRQLRRRRRTFQKPPGCPSASVARRRHRPSFGGFHFSLFLTVGTTPFPRRRAPNFICASLPRVRARNLVVLLVKRACKFQYCCLCVAAALNACSPELVVPTSLQMPQIRW